ncbi:hypothetical protein PV379_00425 [Streptomyces caniscabiei]|uniref:hypothetical protein n=1 Tax=Streptomyces caniscabiei TaxID=2746961 RepID=UPI0029B6FBDA|nr:hypothetical protein [Streptomyces caniscabiei]MDX2775821.1 hypothetical protein [Streptomyces caniscabiei]
MTASSDCSLAGLLGLPEGGPVVVGGVVEGTWVGSTVGDGDADVGDADGVVEGEGGAVVAGSLTVADAEDEADAVASDVVSEVLELAGVGRALVIGDGRAVSTGGTVGESRFVLMAVVDGRGLGFASASVLMPGGTVKSGRDSGAARSMPR